MATIYNKTIGHGEAERQAKLFARVDQAPFGDAYDVYVSKSKGIFRDIDGNRGIAVFTPDGEDWGYLNYQEIATTEREYNKLAKKTVVIRGKEYAMKLFRFEF